MRWDLIITFSVLIVIVAVGFQVIQTAGRGAKFIEYNVETRAVCNYTECQDYYIINCSGYIQKLPTGFIIKRDQTWHP